MVDKLKAALNSEAKSIGALVDTLEYEVVQKIVGMFLNVRDIEKKVIVSGCGTSGAAAKKVAHTLCCVGIQAMFLSPSDAVHGAFGAVAKDDVVVVISKGGNTKELADFVHVAKKKQAKLIAVGENADSYIPNSADVFLKICVEKEPCEWNMLATASTLCVIATFDAIALVIMHSGGYTKDDFLLNHPSGAVGEKLEDQVVK